MRATIAALSAAALVSGCATLPENIEASYVSPVLYENLSCDQLAGEATRVSSAAVAATGAQKKQATSDAVAMGVGLIVFWPALFFIGGNKAKSSEVARLKGEMQAIEQANLRNDCGLIFHADGQGSSPVTLPPTPA